MSVVLAYLAVPSAAAWFTLRQVSKRTWRTVLRRLLDACTESYEWDDEAQESAGCARVRRLVLRPPVVDAAFRALGLRSTEERCTIRSLHLSIQIRLRGDLGLFSEPWVLEMDGVRLALQPLPEGGAVEDEAPPAENAPGEEGGRKAGSSWLPLHRALENLRFSLRDFRVRIQAEGGAAAFLLSWQALRLCTTHADWSPSTGMHAVEPGSILHKLLAIDAFHVAAERMESADTRGEPLNKAEAAPAEAEEELADVKDALAEAACLAARLEEERAEAAGEATGHEEMEARLEAAARGDAAYVEKGVVAAEEAVASIGALGGVQEGEEREEELPMGDQPAHAEAGGGSPENEKVDASADGADARVEGVESTTPPRCRRVVLFDCGHCECRITKELKQTLKGQIGSLATDFSAAEYAFAFSLRSDARPRLSMPNVPLRLSWDAQARAYRVLIDGAWRFDASHELDGVGLYELLYWQATLMAALKSVSPALEIQLVAERRWRFEEHSRAERAQAEVAQLRSALLEQHMKHERERSSTATAFQRVREGAARTQRAAEALQAAATGAGGGADALQALLTELLDASHDLTRASEQCGIDDGAFEDSLPNSIPHGIENKEEVGAPDSRLVPSGIPQGGENEEEAGAPESSSANFEAEEDELWHDAEESTEERVDHTDATDCGQSGAEDARTRRVTWRERSGRSGGADGYRFGDLTRSALRRVRGQDAH